MRVTAPWMKPEADLANADPHLVDEGKLFSGMTDLYWHFAEIAPKGVSFAKISRVLHLKLPHLFPILDSHLARSSRILNKEVAFFVDAGMHPQQNCCERTTAIWMAATYLGGYP